MPVINELITKHKKIYLLIFNKERLLPEANRQKTLKKCILPNSPRALRTVNGTFDPTFPLTV